jgi:hypothetical protein
MAQDALNEALLESARACGKSSHRLWAVDDDSADLDLAERREPVDVWEAERASDVGLLGDIQVGESGVDVGDLLLDAGDQLALVAAVDAEDRAPLGEEPALPVAPDLSAMGLGVNDRDASWSDGDVVDVRLTVPRDAAIVEQPDACPVEQLLQPSADPDLAIATLLPNAGARWLVG